MREEWKEMKNMTIQLSGIYKISSSLISLDIYSKMQALKMREITVCQIQEEKQKKRIAIAMIHLTFSLLHIHSII